VAFTLLTVFLAVAFTLFVAIPIIALLLYVPLATLVDSLSDPVVTDAVRLSLVTSTVATTIVIAFGTPLAFLNTRTDYPGRNMVETLTDLPIVLPPAVAGLGLLLAFGRYGLIGQYLAPFGITIAFTTLAVVMAQTFVAAPFFLRQARTSFGEVDPAYEAAAHAARDLFRPSARHHGLGRPRGHTSRDLVRRHRLGTGSRSPGRADPLGGDGSGDQGRSGLREYARTPGPTILRCPRQHP
jgi:ABC-type spermidine/putrescine transport system permease subunit I